MDAVATSFRDLRQSSSWKFFDTAFIVASVRESGIFAVIFSGPMEHVIRDL